MILLSFSCWEHLYRIYGLKMLLALDFNHNCLSVCLSVCLSLSLSLSLFTSLSLSLYLSLFTSLSLYLSLSLSVLLFQVWFVKFCYLLLLGIQSSWSEKHELNLYIYYIFLFSFPSPKWPSRVSKSTCS